MAEQMQLKFLTLCDLASITREGKLNILGIFQQIFVREFPTRYLKFTIVGIITGTPSQTVSITLKVLDSDNQSAMPDQTVNLQIGNGGRAQMLFDVINLPLNAAGEYTIELHSDDKLLGTSNFEVVKANPSTPQKAD